MKDVERRSSKEEGRHNHDKRFDLHCVHCGNNIHETRTCRILREKIKTRKNKRKEKLKLLNLFNMLLLIVVLS